jgi:hypothetical protein
MGNKQSFCNVKCLNKTIDSNLIKYNVDIPLSGQNRLENKVKVFFEKSKKVI